MEWIENVLRDVAELPDRNSPEDWPEAMLVTGAELRQIIVTHAPAEPVNARLLDALKQAHVALIGYLPEHSNAVTNAAIESARAAIAAAEIAKAKTQPQPSEQECDGIVSCADRTTGGWIGQP